MKDILFFLFGVGLMGAIANTARYLHNLGADNEVFRFKSWFFSAFTGTIVAIIAGLLCKHYIQSEELTYAIVGISAISSKELISFIPKILVGFLKNKIK